MLAFPIPRPAWRQTRLRTPALPPAPTLTPANPSSPAPLALRKRPRRRLMPPCPLRSRHQGPSLYRKEPLYLAPETLKETHALPMPQKTKKDRILSNFTKIEDNGTLLERRGVSWVRSFRRPYISGFDVLVAEALNLILAALFIEAEFSRSHYLTTTFALGVELHL